MQTINVHEAGAHSSPRIEQAAKGPSSVISKSAVGALAVPQRLGFLAGHCTLQAGFDQFAGDKMIDLFEG